MYVDLNKLFKTKPYATTPEVAAALGVRFNGHTTECVRDLNATHALGLVQTGRNQWMLKATEEEK